MNDTNHFVDMHDMVYQRNIGLSGQEARRMADKLTIKQDKFAMFLFAGDTQRKAYKKAFDPKNMSDKTIDEEACKLANSPKIATRLAELTAILQERQMTLVERTLAEVEHIAFDDIRNYLRFYQETPGGDIKMDIKDSDTIDTRSVSEVSVGKDGQFKFKLYCKDDALYKLMAHLGLLKDKVELTGNNGGPIQTQNLTDEELDAKIAQLMGQVKLDEGST